MMKFVFVVLLCVAAASATKLKPFGIVENVVDCGSSGILQFVAVTDCTLAPCQFTPFTTYDIDIVFIASRNAAQLTLNIRVLLDTGAEHVIARVPVQGRIVGGEQFTISFGLPVTSEFSGRSMIVWFELFDEMDERQELCVTASAIVS